GRLRRRETPHARRNPGVRAGPPPQPPGVVVAARAVALPRAPDCLQPHRHDPRPAAGRRGAPRRAGLLSGGGGPCAPGSRGGGGMTQATYITTSWDDGHPLDLRVADLLARHGLRGTFYVPRTAENPTMTARQVRELSGTFEVGGHTLR